MQKNAQFLNSSKQIDKYYQPTYRKFLNDDKNINERLRHNNMYCDEYEVEIDSETNLSKIFEILGLEEIAIVNKTRTTYFYLDKYEVALDYVKDLGYFIKT